MAGGLLQLQEYGYEDVYLTNNPQITFFKLVYRKYTNFSMELFSLSASSQPTFGQKFNIPIFRLGDLITSMHLRIIIDEVVLLNGMKFSWVQRLGHAMINNVSLTIGGIKIDSQYSKWLDIWYSLTRSQKHDRGYDKMLGDVPELTNYNGDDKKRYTLFVPLKFWFNRHVGLALPMISIHYHDVRVSCELNSIDHLIVANDGFMKNYDLSNLKVLDVELITTFIHLDIRERRLFASAGHDYLIEQIQSNMENDFRMENPSRTYKLNFNYQVKELVWSMSNNSYNRSKKFLCYVNSYDPKVWNDEIKKKSKELLLESSLLLDASVSDVDENNNVIEIIPGETPNVLENSEWEEFRPNNVNLISSNKKITVNNYTQDKSFFINFNSISINNTSLIKKINATINISENEKVTVKLLSTDIDNFDISIPLEHYTDTRIKKDDPMVNQFGNYSLLITNELNYISDCSIKYNNDYRVDKRNYNFFSKYQPYYHHSSSPKKGILLYSFSLKPEELQPSGTSNFSVINDVFLTIHSNKKLKNFLKLQFLGSNDPNVNLMNNINEGNNDLDVNIFAVGYNILRILSGLTHLVYNI